MADDSTSFGRDERDRLIRLETLMGAMSDNMRDVKDDLKAVREQLDQKVQRVEDRAEGRHESHANRLSTLQTLGLSLLGSGLLNFLLNHK